MKKNKIIKVKKQLQEAIFSVREESVWREDFNFIFSSLRFFLRSTKIGPQVFVRSEGKVDLRDESYALTPKSWSFDKLRKVGVLSYLKLHFV